ncbi:MAG TPA: TetR/AcrR family transcriptional regulator [Myxococcota bacterium]|nr:TetR/AcrR family transcriptional regulator [Myxococcota bacterium]
MSAARAKRTRRRTRPAARRKAPATTRERLVEATRAVLEEGGSAAASVQAIAERAGLAAGALYRHFPSKADLLVEVFRDAARRDLVAMQRAAATGRSVERLEAAVATFARRALRSRRLAWALVYEPVDPRVDTERLAYRREYCRQMALLLRAGIAAGEIPEQNAELTAAALVGAIAESLVGPLSPIGGQAGSDEELIAVLVRFCRRSLGVRDGATLRSVARGAGRAGGS